MARSAQARPRFLWQLYGGLLSVIALTAVVLGLVFSRLIAANVQRDIERQIRNEASLLAELSLPALRSWEGAGMQSTVQRLGRTTANRFTVIRADGVVVADSQEDPARMDNHLQRPEIQTAHDAGWGKAQRFSHTLGTQMLYYALPVESNGRILGYARAATSLRALNAYIGYVRMLTLLWGLGAILAAAAIGLVIARQITRPVAGMVLAARALAAGDYSQQAPAAGVDELHELGAAFNVMGAELKSRFEMLSSERNQLQAVLAGMVEGVIAVDREERILHINQVAAALFDITPEEGVGRRIWEIVRLPLVVDTLSSAMRDASAVRTETRIPQHGKDVLLELHASPLRDSHNELVGAVLVLHDVSELRRLETVRREFVANVSHELKTPLTAVHGLVETLLDDTEMPSETRQRFLGKIRDQSTRLSALVSDLLTLSRIESDGAELERTLLDLRTPLEDAAQALSLTAEERGLALQIELPPAPVTVLGDHEAMRQIASNLLDNAIKYTAKGGRVALTLRVDQQAAVIEVSDTGIGIEPEEQQRIFERFYRVDKARSRELGGTGLGLSIVKHLTLAQEGKVAVESLPGQGSTFRVQFPLAVKAPDKTTGHPTTDL